MSVSVKERLRVAQTRALSSTATGREAYDEGAELAAATAAVFAEIDRLEGELRELKKGPLFPPSVFRHEVE